MWSTDKRGYFFDTRTIKFGTKELYNNRTYKFYKVVDTSKIIAYIKIVFTEAARREMMEQFEKEGLSTSVIRELDHLIYKYEFDYNKSMVKTCSMIFYDIDGKVLDEMKETHNEPWEDILPDTIGETEANYLRLYADANIEKVRRQTNTL